MGEEKEKESYNCLELWRIPPELGTTAFDNKKSIEEQQKDRDRAAELVAKEYEKRSEGKPFPPNSLTHQATMTPFEYFSAMFLLFFVLGMALLWNFGLFFSVIGACFGLVSWKTIGIFFLLTAILAYHPLPKNDSEIKRWMCRSRLTQLLYMYFTYRIIYSDSAKKDCLANSPWIGVGMPHGAMPFANVLSTPAVESYLYFPQNDQGEFPSFVGAPASIVFNTPFLRYLTMFKTCHVGRNSLKKEMLVRGNNVGLVGDGIAGIFQCNRENEVVALKHRKGLAKLALTTGRPVIPCYSFGNTAAFTCIYDSFGIMEWLSRKAQASIFFYGGPLMLPIPHRVNITLGVGNMVKVEKNENPTKEEIDIVHQKILGEVEGVFNLYKDALGMGQKAMHFV